jgi:hypothetical protein
MKMLLAVEKMLVRGCTGSDVTQFPVFSNIAGRNSEVCAMTYIREITFASDLFGGRLTEPARQRGKNLYEIFTSALSKSSTFIYPAT